MFTPNPVKALLGHAKGNDDVQIIAVGNVAQRGNNRIAPLLGHKVRNLEQAPVLGLHDLNAGGRVFGNKFAQMIQNAVHFAIFVFAGSG